MDWGATTSTGLVRSHNEDRWVHLRRRAFAVADGVGGYEGGDRAATAAVERFTEIAGTSTRRSETAWRQVVGDINTHVIGALAAAGLDAGGTTFLAAIVEADLATVLSVGDFASAPDEAWPTRSTHLRSHAGDGDACRRCPGWERGTRPGALTSYLGIAPDLLRVDVATYEVRPDDCVMLCSNTFTDRSQTM